MKGIPTSLVAGLLLASHAQAEVTLGNLSVSQRAGTKLVDIHYDLDNDDGSFAAVGIVVSNGVIKVESPDLSGDVGYTVPEGAGRHVVWNGGTDLNGTLTSNLSITVSAIASAPSGMVYVPAGSNSGTDSSFGSYSVSSSSNLYVNAAEISKSTWDSAYSWAVGNGYTFNGTHFGKGSSHPITNVDWYDCIVWCNAKSEMEGLTPCYTYQNGNPVNLHNQYVTIVFDSSADGYRLPTNSEWEYLARGGEEGLRFPWGNTITHNEANYQSDSSYSYDLNFDENGYDGYHPDYDQGGYPYTSPGGAFEPNGFGLYDMAGNVWEWCWNASGSARAQRSGSWSQFADEARCGNVDYVTPLARNNVVGFRIVRNAPAAILETATAVFDSRDYGLVVSSARGSPVPDVGTNLYAWMASVTCSVEPAVAEGGTNYTCIGWSGGGSVPASGSSNGMAVVLGDLFSSITWNWASDDNDLDGMDDDWELRYFGNLNQTSTNDFDSDGQTDLEEYIAGTIPTNSASLFRLTTLADPSGLVIQWPSASNRTYNVYWTDNLVYMPFTNLEADIASPRNSTTSTAVNARGYFKIDVRK